MLAARDVVWFALEIFLCVENLVRLHYVGVSVFNSRQKINILKNNDN